MVTVARIRIYPIKSLDGLDVETAQVLPNGALAHDRRFAMMDFQGRLINGKRTPLVHQVRCTFDGHLEHVTLHREGDVRPARFSLHHDRDGLAAWLSDALQMPLRIVENSGGGFPDDVESPGPTLVSRPSLARAASWFAGLDEHQLRRRLRANIEVDGCEPFWEDRLVGRSGEVLFHVGATVFVGTTACARCVVPSRCPQTGERTPEFSAVFMKGRETELPPWAARERFDHYYRMAVNTRGKTSGVITIGDEVSLAM
jgi:uncharacterized protein YcbX